MLLHVYLFLSLLAYARCSSEEKLFHLVVDELGELQVLVKTENVRKDLKVDEDNVRAKVLYKSSINTTGWSFLEIRNNPSFTDDQQAYDAGFVEGFLTHDLIYKHWFNTLGDFCKDRDELCRDIDEYVTKNTEWINDNLKQFASTDQYWHQVNLFYRQIDGLADGYVHANKDPKTALTTKNLLWLNLQGDFEDLTEVFHARKNNFRQTEFQKLGKVQGKGHCSALIKVLPDGSDLFVSQDTWNSYGSMLRIQKKYVFSFHLSDSSPRLVPGSSMTFSSYPGVVTSGDDFYVISSGLVTLETTIGNSNSSLWRFVQPVKQISEGVRSMVANRLAVDGRSWSKIFSRFNSGTYNNQWMIVDYTKFKPGTSPDRLSNNVLWVLEQIPHYIHAEDMTSVLRRQGYWPSYNVAAFKDIFNISGNVPLVEKFGDWFTYERNPRALIFKRDHAKVKDLKSMLELMRYNDFKHDPLSYCDCNPPFSAENAIAARCDLNPSNGTYPFSALGHRSHGATDAKITSLALFLNGLQFMAVSGPVHNNKNGLPPFQWSKSDFASNTPHLGHPDLWVFQPLVHRWA